jgi:predicted membrane protein
MSANDLETGTQGAFRITPRLIIGLGILAVGVLWTCDNLNLIDADEILEWWPAFLILAGLVRLADPTPGKVGAGVLVVVGTVLLLDSIDVADVDLGDLFPLFIAVIGGKLVWDAMNRKPRTPATLEDPSADLHAFAMMSGVKRQSTTRAFQGGDANAIMGGAEIDLRNAEIREGEQPVIDVFAIWGGIEIRVPEGWRVVSQVLPLMGGFDDNTVNKTGSGPVLMVRGTVIMGAVEVKN